MLLRFDPFRELDRVRESVLGAARTALPIDAYRQGDRFVVHVDLPGVDPASVEVTVDKDVLTVRAERPQPAGDDLEWLTAERRHGTFTRQLFLGDALDVDGIEASVDHGVLTVSIPVAQSAKPRKVEVAAGGGRKAIESKASAAV